MKHTYFTFPRNVYLLSLSQVIGMSAVTIVTLLGGLIGAEIAPSPNLVTLPATMMIIGVAATTIPAALLMKRIGRKNGFLLSALVASLSSLLLAFAVAQQNFFLFCLGTFLLGSNGAFVQQYRFAAIESVGKHMASKVVGYVLLAGIVAGILGPEIAKRTKTLFSLPDYTGPFIVLSGLFIISAFLLSFLRNTKMQEEDTQNTERSLKTIIFQPHFFIAVLAGASGFGIMTFIMTATPIHLHKLSHYSLDHTVFIIQSHIIAMFLPSLFTGILIERFGIFRILFSGIISFCFTIFFAVTAQGLLPYWAALVLLGIGWNFLYISSTVLLAQSYSHRERFKAQGLNDFIVVTTQMIASFLAGSILLSFGWDTLTLLTLPLIFLISTVFIINRKRLLSI